jgi:glycerol kinase
VKLFLPTIKSSSEIYGNIVVGHLAGVPISGCLGDQQAALVGEACFKEHMCKNTYGTGCFLLANVGQRPVFSKYGLLTTVAYKFGPDAPTVYALEGSIAVAGNCVRWLRDNLQIVDTSKDAEELAGSVKNTSGVYFVPAFSGLYAPHWHSQARGLIIGLTGYTTKAHIARAALEAVCFQTREILEAMCNDGGVSLSTVRLLVDGGMTKNDLLMQIQADFLGVPVVRPQLVETSSLGAAIAAGMAKGVDLWTIEYIENHPPALDKFLPKMSSIERDETFARWKKAVKRAMNWTGDGIGVSAWAALQPVVVPFVMFASGVAATLLFQKILKR